MIDEEERAPFLVELEARFHLVVRQACGRLHVKFGQPSRSVHCVFEAGVAEGRSPGVSRNLSDFELGG
jgi:hypothetical protein